MKRLRAMLDRPFAGLAVALLLAFAWTGALWVTRPAVLFNEDFVVSEQGHNLVLVDQILAGKRLYRDMFSQYGPLPTYALAAWAACFGNTARSYLALMGALTLVNVALLYRVLRRSVPGAVALGWLVAAVFPFFILPGSFATGQLYALYPVCERALLLLVALAWVDPRVRSPGRALWLGVLLGAMQWVKFGGAFMAGGALVAVDLVILGRTLADPATWRRWLPGMLCILAGFLGMEGLLATGAFLTLPGTIARDVLWPAYMLKNYASYAADVPRYVSWVGWRYFAEVQLPVAIAVLLNLGLLWRVAARRGAAGDGDTGITGRAGPLLFFACYFPLALKFYLPHVWVAGMSAWMFVAAGVYVFNELRLPMRGLVLLGLLPCFYVSMKFLRPDGHAPARVTMPDGESLWLEPEWQTCFARLQTTLASLDPPGPPALMILPIGSGWFHYFPASRHFTRHTWLMPGFVRPDEEAALADSLTGTTAVVVFVKGADMQPLSPDPAQWKTGLNPRFAPAVDAVFARRLGAPIQIGEHCTVFPVKR